MVMDENKGVRRERQGFLGPTAIASAEFLGLKTGGSKLFRQYKAGLVGSDPSCSASMAGIDGCGCDG